MITIIAGQSSSGKDTLLRELARRGTVRPLVSTTTRPMREGEADGREYDFIEKEDFLNKVAKNEFLEYRSYDTLVNGHPDTWYYGSPKLPEETVQNIETAVILDIQGTRDYVSFYGKENCLVIMLEVDEETRRQRAIERGSYDETEWNRRLEDDRVKFSKEATGDVVDVYLKNDCSIEELANKVEALIKEREIMLEEDGCFELSNE